MIKYLSKGGPWMLACCSYTNMTICIIQFNAVRYFLHAVYSPIIVHIGATIGLLPFSCWVHQLLPPGSCVLRKAVTYCAHTAFIKKAVLRRHPLLVICSWCDLRNLFQLYIVDDELKNHFLLFFFLSTFNSENPNFMPNLFKNRDHSFIPRHIPTGIVQRPPEFWGWL